MAHRYQFLETRFVFICQRYEIHVLGLHLSLHLLIFHPFFFLIIYPCSMRNMTPYLLARHHLRTGSETLLCRQLRMCQIFSESGFRVEASLGKNLITCMDFLFLCSVRIVLQCYWMRCLPSQKIHRMTSLDKSNFLRGRVSHMHATICHWLYVVMFAVCRIGEDNKCVEEIEHLSAAW